MTVPVMVRFALRAAPALAAMANETVPLPVPDAPAVTVRNAALDVAVHAQLDDVLTEIVADPPAAGKAVVVCPVMI
jgi:hypothetical protein